MFQVVWRQTVWGVPAGGKHCDWTARISILSVIFPDKYMISFTYIIHWLYAKQDACLRLVWSTIIAIDESIHMM